MSYYRPLFRNFFEFSPLWGVILILMLGIPRFSIVLHANATANYNYTSLVFIAMWILPFVLLKKEGRRLIGIKGTNKFRALLLSAILGGIIAMGVYILGYLLYGLGTENWYVYISRSYSGSLPDDLDQSRHIYFLIFALISMVFSPIGEEFMYRGMIHQCFEGKYGGNKASIIDSAAFALTHLAHFGIVFNQGEWSFLLVPALFWVLCTYFASRLFYRCKCRADSIWGAVLAHAGFNLVMTYIIFYFILP